MPVEVVQDLIIHRGVKGAQNGVRAETDAPPGHLIVDKRSLEQIFILSLASEITQPNEPFTVRVRLVPNLTPPRSSYSLTDLKRSDFFEIGLNPAGYNDAEKILDGRKILDQNRNVIGLSETGAIKLSVNFAFFFQWQRLIEAVRQTEARKAVGMSQEFAETVTDLMFKGLLEAPIFSTRALLTLHHGGFDPKTPTPSGTKRGSIFGIAG